VNPNGKYLTERLTSVYKILDIFCTRSKKTENGKQAQNQEFVNREFVVLIILEEIKNEIKTKVLLSLFYWDEAMIA